MRCQFPESGACILKPGDEVYVLGRSQKRGYLIVEHSGQQIHMPHQYTELRVSTRNTNHFNAVGGYPLKLPLTNELISMLMVRCDLFKFD